MKESGRFSTKNGCFLDIFAEAFRRIFDALGANSHLWRS
jgi:hypothetical protein